MNNNHDLLPVFFHNWWEDNPRIQWFYRFIQARKIKFNRPLHFFTVFGPREALQNKNIYGAKIFYTGEDVYENAFVRHQEYQDYCLNEVDLALGFDLRGHSKYLRFPVWFLYLIDPTWNEAQIHSYIQQINAVENRLNLRVGFMSHISRHDSKYGMRTYLVNLFNQIATVSCAGRCLNNTDQLVTMFNNNKLDYLRHFKFNLCPENTSVNQYVTEKCFEAIMAGCIPIYWGGGQLPQSSRIF